MKAPLETLYQKNNVLRELTIALDVLDKQEIKAVLEGVIKDNAQALYLLTKHRGRRPKPAI